MTYSLRRVAPLAALALALPLVSAADAAPASTPPAAAVEATAALSDDHIDRVVAISVDGLNPSAVLKLGAAKAPNYYRMAREGSWTFNARTAVEQTVTLPNHTGMLTGRRIDRRVDGHGMSVNSYDGRTTVHAAAGRYVASAFDVVHDRGGTTALYTSKEKFALFRQTWNAAGRPDPVGRNYGPAKISRYVLQTDNAALTARVTADLNRLPATFTFVHLSLPDSVGHDAGFMSPRYLAAVQRTDALVGQILQTVRTRPALRQNTAVLLTADHGGSGSSHGDARKLANYRVPFMAWGRGVPRGRDLYGLNRSAYRNPGVTRPGYSGAQPIRNADLANLATDLLDLPRVPGSRINRYQRLTVIG